MRKAPPDLIKQGTPERPQPLRFFNAKGEETRIGETVEGEPFALSAEDRNCHTHVIGSTGGGKSKLLEYLIRQDLMNPKAGLCVIDPHGLLYDDLVHYISHVYPRLAKRVVLFNPAGDLDQVLGFNPIPAEVDDVPPIANHLTSAVLKALGQDSQAHTPRIARWLKNIFHALVANRLTLLEAFPFFDIYDASRRRDILRTVNSETVLADWTAFDKMTPKDRIQTIEGAANRLVNFLENRRIRHMIGQSAHALDLGRIMDEGKILLVNLNGGVKIPHESTHLLGVFLVNELVRTAKLRDPDDTTNQPFHIYIDEFGQYISRDIARALEECRKNKVFMTLAHQHLAQLKAEDEYLYASVLTNCKNKYVFGGLSKEDADIMTHEIATGFLDLLKIKDEVYTTKARHIEETRKVRSSSFSNSETDGTGGSEGASQSDAMTASVGGSETFSASMSDTKGRGRSQTDSNATSHTDSQSETDTQTSGATEGKSNSVSDMETKGTSTNRTVTEGEGETSNWSTTETSNFGHTTNQSQGSNTGSSSSRPINGQGGSDSLSSSKFTGRAASFSKGGSHSETRGGSSSKTKSVANGQGENESRGHTEGSAHHQSTHQSASKAKQRGQSDSRSESHSDTVSENENHSEGQGFARQNSQSTARSHTDTTQTSASWSKTTTQAETQGESEVPFLRPEEFTELTSRTFWSRDELHYMEMSKIKNQETGVAFVKIGIHPPVQVEVDFVATPFKSKRSWPKKIDKFTQAVFEAHADFYTPQLLVHEEYETRHRSLFSDGQPIAFDEGPMEERGVLIDVTPETDPEDPFTS